MSSLFSRISQRIGAQLSATRSGLMPFEKAETLRLPLLRFSASELDRWLLHDDRKIGGFSEGGLQLGAVDAHRSSMLWSGRLALEADILRQQAVPKSQQLKPAEHVGFVAMRRTVAREHWELHDFDGLCLRARFHDERAYVLTVRADTILGDHRIDDLYQALIPPFAKHAKPAVWADDGQADVQDGGDAGDDGEECSSGGFVDVRIPWGAFALTWRGNVQSMRAPPMNLDRITHIGMRLSDRADGEFAIELGGIDAFRYDAQELRDEDHPKQAMRLNMSMGYDDATTG